MSTVKQGPISLAASPSKKSQKSSNKVDTTAPSVETLTPSQSGKDLSKTGRNVKKELPRRIHVFRPSKFHNLLERLEAEGNLFPPTKQNICMAHLKACWSKAWNCCLCSNEFYSLDVLLTDSFEVRKSFGIKVFLILGLYFAIPIPFIIAVGFTYKPRGESEGLDHACIGVALASLATHIIIYVVYRVVVVPRRTSKYSSSRFYLWMFMIVSEILLILFTTILTLYLIDPARKSDLDGRKSLPMFILLILSSNCFILSLTGITADIDYKQTKIVFMSLVICICFLLAIALLYSLLYAVEILKGRGNCKNSVVADLLTWLPILVISSIIITPAVTREVQMLIVGRRVNISSIEFILAAAVLTWSFVFPSILCRIRTKITKIRTTQQKVVPSPSVNSVLSKLLHVKVEEKH